MINIQGFWLLLALMASIAVFILAAVALGGLLVFRTKRESWESPFTLGENKGEAFHLDDDFSREEETEPSPFPEAFGKAMPDVLQRMNEKIRGQIRTAPDEV